MPAGNYAVILGAETDPNSAFLRSGMTDAGIPALGDTTGPGSRSCSRRTPTTGIPRTPRTTWKRRSTPNHNKIDAVLSENDSMATGVVQALDAVGLKIPVSGQDGDTAALNRVALGTQAVSVWKNAFALGETAGSVAVQLCARTALTAVKAPGDLPGRGGSGVAQRHPVHDPGRQDRPVDHPTPTAITKDNVKDTVDAGLGHQGAGLRRRHRRIRARALRLIPANLQVAVTTCSAVPAGQVAFHSGRRESRARSGSP